MTVVDVLVGSPVRFSHLSIRTIDDTTCDMRCQFFFVLFDALPQAVLSLCADQGLNVPWSRLLLALSTRSAHLHTWGICYM